MGPGAKRLSTPRRPHSESGRDRQGRGQLRVEHVRSGGQSARQRRADFAGRRAKRPQRSQGFAQYAGAQDQLGTALSRLLAVSENYPQLKATENFQTLQAQLEGAENRIAYERKKYNDVARAFNTKRDTFPTVMIAGMFGSRFNEKPYFQSQPGAEKAPVVNFSP